MVKVLVVLGRGGHTTELLRLVDLIGKRYEYTYLVSDNDPISHLKIRISGEIYRAILPMEKRHHQKKSLPILRIIITVLQQLIIILRVRPQVVFSAGAGIAIPAAIWGRLFGAKVIHVETGARVLKLSTSGRIMYRIAHLFFVQWESLQEKYPKSIFAGRLL